MGARGCRGAAAARRKLSYVRADSYQNGSTDLICKIFSCYGRRNLLISTKIIVWNNKTNYLIDILQRFMIFE